MSDLRDSSVVREVAEEAANKATEYCTREMRLLLAESKVETVADMRECVDEMREHVDESLKNFLGMSNTDHIRVHSETERVVEEFHELKAWVQKAVAGAVLAFVTASGANFYTAVVRADALPAADQVQHTHGADEKLSTQ